MQEISIPTEYKPIYGMAAGGPKSPLVVGVHGWSQRNGWQTWAPLVQPLGDAGCYAVSVDMPGWGNSLSWSGHPMSVDEGVLALEAIISGLGHSRAAIMGKSWGGGIALELALRQPEKVAALILSAPAYRNIEHLSGMTIPVLLAWSRDDPIIPYRYAAEYVRTLPQAELISYDQGGHSAGPKNADHFALKVIEFLGASF